uniref:Ovule protein n=1 Tax=Haemonchus contortus TaxID=6289 RepID=A0A7I4YNL2_HAECO
EVSQQLLSHTICLETKTLRRCFSCDFTILHITVPVREPQICAKFG